MDNENKEIRFIDSKYNELFRIPDGGYVRITNGHDGKENCYKCRYIDDYHFSMGKYNGIFHICQFAEIRERNNDTYEPVTAERDILYISETYGEITEDKFYKTDAGFTEIYYNPDADAGGQLVYVEVDNDTVKEAGEKCKTPIEFFSYIESMGKGSLIDAGTPEFRSAVKDFMESPADVRGTSLNSMRQLKKIAAGEPDKQPKIQETER